MFNIKSICFEEFISMTKNTYPNNIAFYGEEMNQIISMKREFKVERKVMRHLSVDDTKNVYISPEKQNKYQVHFNEEKEAFVNANKETLDGEYNFVLTCEENPKLLCDINLNHSYLGNGKKVLGAGSLLFNNGSLEEISNNSGHYRPTNNEMLPFIKAMNTLSIGKVVSYNSYCTYPSKTFPMEELLDINDFTEIHTFENNEKLDSSSKKRKSKSGYGNIEQQNKQNEKQEEDGSKRYRFGQNISKVLMFQYVEVLENIISNKREENINKNIQSQKSMRNQLGAIRDEKNEHGEENSQIMVF